jgi:Tol biopolymer transport system component
VSDRFPAWSPDGRRLVVRRTTDSIDKLVVVDGSTGDERVLARFHPKRDLNRADWHAQWSSDGRAIVTDIGAVVTLIDVSSGERRVLSPFAIEARLSPTGHRALVDSFSVGKQPCPYICEQDDGLLVVDLKTSRTTRVFMKLPRYAIDAEWSPDGRQIAVVRPGDISDVRGLVVVRPDGTHLRTLVRRR